MKAPKQFNNITERFVDMKASLTTKSRLSIAAVSFSIYAYQALNKELEAVEELRFIFISPTFSTDKTAKQKREFYIPKLNRKRNFYGSEFETRLRNQLTQKAIARECADWIRRKVKFKSNVTSGTMNTVLSGYFSDVVTSILWGTSFMIGYLSDNVIQILSRIDIVSLAGHRQRTDGENGALPFTW